MPFEVGLEPSFASGGPDATAAIQSALDDGGLVRLPVGTFRITSPLWIRNAGTILQGRGRTLSVLRAVHGGPMILVGPDVGGPSYEAPLVPGPGQSVRFDASGWYLNLRQAKHVDMDGWTAVTLRCFYRPDPGASGTDRSILANCGRLLRSDPVIASAQLRVQPDGVLLGTINTTDNGLLILTGGAVTDGKTHELELSWDGTTARLFVDGAMVASKPATGKLVQAAESNMTLGPRWLTYPESDGDLAGPLGLIYSVEIANTARHTAAYAHSTAAYSPDGYTQLLLNFDAPSPCGALVQGYRAIGPYVRGWLVWTRQTYDALTTDCGVQDLGLNGGGISGGIAAWLSPRGDYEDLDVQATWWGVRLANNCYSSRVQHLSVMNGFPRSLYGLVFMGASGVCVARDLELAAGVVALMARGASVDVDHSFVFGQTIFGALSDSTGRWCGVSITTEATPVAPRANLALDGATGLTWHGGGLDATGFACPLVVVNGGDGHRFRDTAFKIDGTNPHVFQVVNPPASQITVDMPAVPAGSPAVPWFDVPSAGTVTTAAPTLVANR